MGAIGLVRAPFGGSFSCKGGVVTTHDDEKVFVGTMLLSAARAKLDAVEAALPALRLLASGEELTREQVQEAVELASVFSAFRGPFWYALCTPYEATLAERHQALYDRRETE